MSTLVGSHELRSEQEPSRVKPLEEAVWQAWLARGCAREKRGSETRVKVVKWFTTAGLLAAAELWSYVTPYDAEVRFFVTAGAIVVMFQAFGTKDYSVAAVFGALALLYNPLVPTFSLSGDWQRAVVVASAVPFVASLPWRNEKTERNA
jgi:hypothetical protein